MSELAKAVVRVMRAVRYVPETGRNQFHRYSYASDEDLLTVLQPAMAENGLALIPCRTDVKVEAHSPDAKGKPQWRTELVVTYKLLHESGEAETVQAPGCGIDGEDKGTYKAMTGALKYALRHLFLVPTGQDAERAHEDSHPPATQGRPSPSHQQQQRPQANPQQQGPSQAAAPTPQAASQATPAPQGPNPRGASGSTEGSSDRVGGLLKLCGRMLAPNAIPEGAKRAVRERFALPEAVDLGAIPEALLRGTAASAAADELARHAKPGDAELIAAARNAANADLRALHVAVLRGFGLALAAAAHAANGNRAAA
ncbi:MAG TPA: ERF family protein [Phycisphaerales bacterium]|nr:ERF family protein [Phycisphaerales bacterium]